MKKLIILLVVVVSWSFSNAQSSYFPIEKGAKWTYSFGKEIYGGTPYENYTNTVEILQTMESIEGKEYFVVETSMGDKKGTPTVIISYLRFDSQGSLLTKSAKEEKELVAMKNTPKVGDEYASQRGGTSKVLDLDATIKTPVTTYTSCLMIEVKDKETTSRAYYQKNKGMVATTIISDGKEKVFLYLKGE